MKKLLTILLLSSMLFSTLVLVSCSKNDSKNLTSEEIANKLKDEKLPISNIIVYTEETDKNKLLGRPNQYISKVNFADTRIEQSNIDKPKGGSIEIFNNVTDLNTRKSYIESISKYMPMLTEYMLVNGNYLLRLNKELTNAQVNEYKEVFIKIK